ncbi:MAG: cysteine desulfurase family protein [Chitinophagales bacterium]|nr:cysteine desulfurase [Bacteroidota bacterium]MCB9042381.1 cysteine desulfurase [Chitinophagales bacterium]
MSAPEILYFDNAATTAVAPQVLEAMLPYFTHTYGNPSSVHHLGRQARAAIEKARKQIAQHLQASPSEVFFTSCGTEANNTILLGAVRDLGIQRIISSPTEHHCILHSLEDLQHRHNIEVVYLSVNEKGQIDITELETLLYQANAPTTLVSLMHANNEIGTMIDLAKIATLCKAAGAYVHSDMVQTFAHYPINLQEIPLDFMASSAHKFHGPKGVGFMYMRTGNVVKSMILGGAQERNLRAGTENIAGIMGMTAAANLAYQNLEKDTQYIFSLKKYLQQQLLQNFPHIQFNGDVDGNSLYTILNVGFCQKNYPTELLLFQLDVEGICVSAGSACSSGSDIGSHVLKAIKSSPAHTAVRFSLSKFNTKSEIDMLIQRLQGILLPEKMVAHNSR